MCYSNILKNGRARGEANEVAVTPIRLKLSGV